MRFGLLQIGLGVALVAFAFFGGGVFWALAWPGVSVFVVGAAYLSEWPGVFGKSPSTGALSWLPIVMLLPYFAVAWTLWQLKSRLSNEAPFDEVAPGILVGRRAIDASEAPEDVAVVVDLTSEFRRSPHYPGRHVTRPTLDTRPPSELGALVEALADETGPILFHCAMGHGRSATAAAALMIHRGLAPDVDAAVTQMKAARPGVHLHRAQREAVRRL
ncbi:MAG: protein-tyrosine phosphatase family protein [Sandaracinaceae bacterium]